jgi:nucleoid-associated protein YgaU
MTIKPSVYVVGTQPPVLPPDPGAGRWNSIPRTTSMIVLKAILTGRIEGVPGAVLTAFAPLFVGGLFVGGSALQGAASYFGGDDAVKHMLHYLGNTGRTYPIDFQGMIFEVPLARQVYDAQVQAAKKFIESLPPGKHDFTSTTGSLNHYIHQGISRNWFFAVGSYTSWGRGVANIQKSSGKLGYSMDYEYNFFDRYNWDGGKQVQIPIPGYHRLPGIAQGLIDSLPNVTAGQLTVTDRFMAQFHLQGLAQEFDMVGTIRKPVTWQPGVVTYKVRPGDSLSAIANVYYGDMSKWPLIHKDNQAAIPNPNRIEVGQELKIPL